MENNANKLAHELEEIEKKEEVLLEKINYEINKDEIKKKRAFREIMHFSFADFAQIVIGCCVFGLPSFINTSFWDYLPFVRIGWLFSIHMFFVFSIILALNYEYRDNFGWDFWFFKMLFKRFFYTYFSVFMIIIFMLALVGKMRYGLTNYEVFMNYLAAQSVGLFGAVTFSFLKR